jgi:hypothetical protein
MMFDEGNRMPRITSFMLPNAGNDVPCAPATALGVRAGSPTVEGDRFSMAASAAELRPSAAGNLPACSM